MFRRHFLKNVCEATAGSMLASPGGLARAWVLGGTFAASRVVQAAQLDTSGAADMTAALQRSAAAAGEGGIVQLPAGDILVSGRIEVPHPRQQWVGAGRGATRIIFAPNGDETLLSFGSRGNISPQQSLRGLTITSADGKHRKTAVELIDTSDFVMEDVEITGRTRAAGTFTWSGGADGSIGVHTRGREAPRFGGGCYISADNPFRISRNLRNSTPQIDADFFSLRDVYMIAHGFPNILIDGDVELSNFLVDGCSMVRGTNAIKWIGSGASRAPFAFTVRASRWEQAEDPDAYAFDIQPNKNLYGLSFDGLSIPPMSNGFRLRNCVGPSFKQVLCNQSGPKDVLNVDASVTLMRHENCLWGVDSVATIVGQRVIWAAGKSANREPLPRNALYDAESNADAAIGFDAALGGRTLVLADRAAGGIGPAGARGWLLVVDNDGAPCQFALRGGAKTVNYNPALDPASAFSATAGTPGRTNVYWSAKTSRYEIENLRGGTRSYRFSLVGSWGGV